MTNADKIRQMSDEQLSRFLWIWKINSVTTFLTQGGMNSMDAKDMRKWVGESTDTFVCTETFVGDDYIFDQDFNVKTDRKTENSSEKPNNCEYAENPSGDVWECGCFHDTYCEHQIYDRNPDGTINIVECGYEPKDKPTGYNLQPIDKDINVRSNSSEIPNNSTTEDCSD